MTSPWPPFGGNQGRPRRDRPYHCDSMPTPKPKILLMGQTPPPWHGQAVATQILFDHDWPDFDVHRLRMEFSEEMLEVGRFQWKKIRHLFRLIVQARRILKEKPGSILFYPPASAKWIPFLRDVVFLIGVRPVAGATVFIYHASGLPVFVRGGALRRWLGGLAYGHADVSLEVAQEKLPPHEVFHAKSWKWCPCAIEVPEMPAKQTGLESPFRILFVGSLQEGKGVLEILKTAALLKKRGHERDFRFQIVGKWFSSEFEVAVRHLREELHVESMVELVGQLTGDDKWRAYADSDVFFFPTHYESEASPIVLMEALGAGLPVVSTAWAGIPALLEGCETARLLPIRSPEAYGDALMEFYRERAKATKWESASKAFYQDRFLPARFIERVGAAFREAAKEPVLQLPAARHFGEPVGQKSQSESGTTDPFALTETPKHRNTEALHISISAYLADQNPGYDRSFGISRMSQVVLDALKAHAGVRIEAITSRTSQSAPASVDTVRVLPWGTRRKWVRLATDHLHPLFKQGGDPPDIHYFPKGYLPLLGAWCRPSVVTIHDTIIQYDEDHYPDWRNAWEYRYWAMMLKHTLRSADRILTVSESSKRQIQDFMDRHRIPRKEITVTYEPCLYENIPQPDAPPKDNYVIHLASCEPHKRTAHLVRWWHEAESEGRELPMLHLIGTIPPEVAPLLASSRSIVKRPFLEDGALQGAYLGARALILPSEIEGFGLPALEAYYLGTPVCFVRGTSVEEILGVGTNKGGFTLESPDSLFAALNEVESMSSEEVRDCGLKLRETYAATRVAERMIRVFEEVKNR